ncbi:hypothetical protein, variant 1 [Aphanomyces invadans]|uniref:Phosphoribulokinase/uridine kinase domain-containing protein n=1 Tax=Aphanomyces invadans TaxID=157072 RepID=A0A024U2J2_9STRA|nr:hypothetical protein, variant 1 [Aphanomyces invadans]ETW00661.1 hypothetical protein, variant 1 [Aphanomyces invadans]|eukprot:XP_008870796.1 hypothetical protein, variant 1 [Aphanomyces invadans]
MAMTRAQTLGRVLEPLLMAASMQVPSKFPSKAEYVHQLIHTYYLPVFFWAEMQLKAPCSVLGLSCVQGGGKTTMSSYLETLFRATGKTCATLSLDDVYLSRADQLKVAASFPHNPLLEHRGNPGTHDLNLLLSLIDDAQAGCDVVVPRYDKSAHNGRGDRFSRDQWITYPGPVDVLLVEGWCLGFEANAVDPPGHLGAVNKALRDFDRLYEALSALIVIHVDDIQWVYTYVCTIRSWTLPVFAHGPFCRCHGWSLTTVVKTQVARGG